MIEGWALWLLLVGLAVGAAGMAMLTARLPREDDDLGSAERRTEAEWISSTIERHGGIAPASLVEEVLELHSSYLATARPAAPLGATAPPVPSMSPWAGAPVAPGAFVAPGSPPPAMGTPPGSGVPPGSPMAPSLPPLPGYVPPPSYVTPPPPGPPPGPPTRPGASG